MLFGSFLHLFLERNKWIHFDSESGGQVSCEKVQRKQHKPENKANR